MERELLKFGGGVSQTIVNPVVLILVLLTGYSTDGGIQMNDPWYFDSAKLNDRYGYPNSGIVSIRTFMPADVRRGMNWLANAVAAVHLAQ